MIWRDVVGYEGIYEVSNTGEVRTKDGKTTYSVKHGKRSWKQRVLKQKVCKQNSCRVDLYKDKVGKTWLVHRLVAEAFIPKIKGKNYVNHIDGNRLNNHVSNLEWCDHHKNNNHAFDNDLINSKHKVVLVNKKSKETHYFRSLSRASEFLGFNSGYLSGRFNRGKYELQNYDVFVELGSELKRNISS